MTPAGGTDRSAAISAIIPARNVEPYVEECVTSLLSQSLPLREIVIVDDASTDGTQAILRRLASDHPTVRVIERPNATGAAAARNLAAREATGDFILLQDADDRSWTRRAEVLLDVFQLFPNLAVAGSAARLIDPSGRGTGLLAPPISPRSVALRMKHAIAFCHASTMIRRDAFLSVGGYDERLPVAHDFHLLARILAHADGANSCQVLYDYRIHGHQLSFSPRRSHLRRFLAVQLARNLREDPAPVIELLSNPALAKADLVALGFEERQINDSLVESTLYAADLLSLQRDYSGSCDVLSDILEELPTVSPPLAARAALSLAFVSLRCGNRAARTRSLAELRNGGVKTTAASLIQVLGHLTRQRLHRRLLPLSVFVRNRCRR